MNITSSVHVSPGIGKERPVYFERTQNMTANKHLARNHKFLSQGLRNLYLVKKVLLLYKNYIYTYIYLILPHFFLGGIFILCTHKINISTIPVPFQSSCR
jgi:hypothetical protein